MTQEEKELLLKDLCSRVLYRPKGIFLHKLYDPEEVEVIGYSGKWVEVHRKSDFDEIPIELVRLYLRPMSSMTEEEKRELHSKYNVCLDEILNTLTLREHSEGYWDEDTECSFVDYLWFIDWLNVHHFDYRMDPVTGKSMIDMGLALEAPEGMYKKG